MGWGIPVRLREAWGHIPDGGEVWLVPCVSPNGPRYNYGLVDSDGTIVSRNWCEPQPLEDYVEFIREEDRRAHLSEVQSLGQ